MTCTAALKAGPIPGPYVLVGHSLGGLEARIYAQRWPKEVVGMVLVDTSPAGEGLIDENQPGFDEVDGRESYAAGKLHCALLAAHGPLEPSRPEYKDCSFALPSDTPAAFRKICASVLHGLLFRRSGLAHVVGVHTPVRQRRPPPPWRNAPGRAVGGELMGNARRRPVQPSLLGRLHEALAHLSSRGVHRIIQGSGHEIQLEKPQVVIDAVDEVLRELQTGGPS